MQIDNKELSFGQRMVGLNFNPSGDDEVTKCKQLFADAIDQQHRIVMEETGTVLQPNGVMHDFISERGKTALYAIHEVQTAQMWAVKSLTWK